MDNNKKKKKKKSNEGSKNKNWKSEKQPHNVGKEGNSKKMKDEVSVKPNDLPKQQTMIRKRVDPETAKYFAEIAKLFEGSQVELEERSAICGNALEETRGKEVELANDMIISHTLESLLEGCNLEQLCGFLQNCAEEFSCIAKDKFGSHVAETALKSIAMHLQDDEGSISMIEDTLTKICQMVVLDAVNIMSCSYGSHVLRSLLCLCKGVPLDTLEEFHGARRSAVLAERWNFTSPQRGRQKTDNFQHCFIDVFNLLVTEMLAHARDEIKTLRVNKYSSFVLQTVVKLLVGHDQELLHAILIILDCDGKNMIEEKFIKAEAKHEIIALLEDNSFSHLFEVIIGVAPEPLYDELLNEVFKGSLFEISSLQCGNFVVQALIFSAKTKNQVNLIWKELGPKFETLLEIGKSGVVASILAMCQRLQTCVRECCQALSAAVSTQSESATCIVPHILFLESYFRQKSSWKWPLGDKMNTLGCLMLQIILKCSKQFIQAYLTSISTMDAEHIFETAKDAGGSRVLESFLCSEASPKQKSEIITRLQGRFGELATHTSSSFTVEKCFAASNVSLKSAIVSELLAIHADLSKMKHGPYLLKKLDVDGFARRPDQWKRSQASKETIYKEFQATFGSNSQRQEQPEPSKKSSNKRRKRENEKTNDETDNNFSVPKSNPSLESEFPEPETSMAKMGILGNDQSLKRERPSDATTVKEFSNNKKFLRNPTNSKPFLRNSGKRKSLGSELSDQNYGKRKSSESELAELAGKRNLSSRDVQKLFNSTTTSNEIKLSGTEWKPFLKKQRR